MRKAQPNIRAHNRYTNTRPQAGPTDNHRGTSKGSQSACHPHRQVRRQAVQYIREQEYSRPTYTNIKERTHRDNVSSRPTNTATFQPHTRTITPIQL